MSLPAGTQWIGGIACTPDGAVYVEPTGTAAITGGTADDVTLARPTITGVPIGVAKVVAASAIPFIHLSSASVTAGGAVTGITAVPLVYANAYCYFPANALATSIVAGWHYCVFSSTTACTAYLNTSTSGLPTIPAAPHCAMGGNQQRERQEPWIPVGCHGDHPALCAGEQPECRRLLHLAEPGLAVFSDRLDQRRNGLGFQRGERQRAHQYVD
jgi:hypothetical protein